MGEENRCVGKKMRRIRAPLSQCFKHKAGFASGYGYINSSITAFHLPLPNYQKRRKTDDITITTSAPTPVTWKYSNSEEAVATWWQEGGFSTVNAMGGEFLNYIHSFGLPWWLSIITSALLVRIALFPLTALQNNNRLINTPYMLDMQAKNAANPSPENRSALVAETLRMFKGTMFYGLLQVPASILLFTSVRRLCLESPDVASGGALFFTNLAESNWTLVLSIIAISSTVNYLCLHHLPSWKIPTILGAIFALTAIFFPAGTALMFGTTTVTMGLFQRFMRSDLWMDNVIPHLKENQKYIDEQSAKKSQASQNQFRKQMEISKQNAMQAAAGINTSSSKSNFDEQPSRQRVVQEFGKKKDK